MRGTSLDVLAALWDEERVGQGTAGCSGRNQPGEARRHTRRRGFHHRFRRAFRANRDVREASLVAVDDEHIYWTETFSTVTSGSTRAAIARANLDGTGVEKKIRLPWGAGIAVDNNYIYWTGGNAIGRAGIDGTRVEQDFIPVPVPTNSPLATLGPVEVDAEHVYWLNAVAGSPPGSVQPTIARANLDGTAINVSFIADWGPTFAPYPNDVAVDAGHVYWTNSEPTSTIGRADLDGSNLDQRFIVPAEGADLSSVAVDGLTDRKLAGKATSATPQRQRGTRDRRQGRRSKPRSSSPPKPPARSRSTPPTS